MLVAALLGCIDDAARARELLRGPGASAGPTARDALVEATTLDPTLREAWSRLAEVELEGAHWAEADDAARHAIAIADTTPREHEVREQALVALGREGDAEPEIERAIALGAAEAPARVRLGIVQAHGGRLDDAIASYRRAIELDASLRSRCGLAHLLFERSERVPPEPDWQANVEEVRALLAALRGDAAGTPYAEDVAALDERLRAHDARTDAFSARVMDIFGGAGNLGPTLGQAGQSGGEGTSALTGAPPIGARRVEPSGGGSAAGVGDRRSR